MANHMFAIFYILILSQQFCTIFCDNEENLKEPIVQIQQGKLKGAIAEDYNGNNYYSFKGIPYAKPPIGDLRFKAPVPAEPWTGIFDATKEVNTCVQIDLLKLFSKGTEDCLQLNVYTKEIKNNGTLKPVMVWVHGGGFASGSSSTKLFGPEFLITEDIVLVSINYRVSILGFLSLKDTSLGVPGNAGLKDMALALQWVQDNIKEFNGDPNNVTIFGESAGSAACHYLLLSESTKGLFHRAILQSGVALNIWASGLGNAIEISQRLGENVTNEAEALEFLKGLPIESILEAEKTINEKFDIDNRRNFGPVIEKPNPEAFITEKPIDLMLAGKYNKVPLIIGYTNREGMLIDFLAKINNITIPYRMEDFEKVVPFYYHIKPGTELSKTIAKKIEDYYYGVSKTPEEDIDKNYIINSDRYFIRGIHVSTRAFFKTLNQPIYFYRFNIETSLNILKNLGNFTVPGVCHADDLGYIFKAQFAPKIEPGTEEDTAIKRIVKLWTNFAKNGNPNPETKDPLIEIEWPQATAENFQCLDIDKTYSISTNPEHERMKFWDEISALDGVNSKY